MRVTERELQSAVIECARLLGWLVYHTHDSRHSAKGFPDLVCVRRGWLIFAELKTGKGKLSLEQGLWFARLFDVEDSNPQVEVHIWRPDDWVSGRIEKILRGSQSRSHVETSTERTA